MKELKLTTAVEKQIGKFNAAEIIPTGTTGRVIDIMLETKVSNILIDNVKEIVVIVIEN